MGLETHTATITNPGPLLGILTLVNADQVWRGKGQVSHSQRPITCSRIARGFSGCAQMRRAVGGSLAQPLECLSYSNSTAIEFFLKKGKSTLGVALNELTSAWTFSRGKRKPGGPLPHPLPRRPRGVLHSRHRAKMWKHTKELVSCVSETAAPSALSNVYFSEKRKYVPKLNNVHVV